MDVISSQGSSLLSVDLTGSEISDSGLIYLKDCTDLQALNLNYCDQISDRGLQHISGNLLMLYYSDIVKCKISIIGKMIKY